MEEKLFCKTGGCGAKLGPKKLSKVLSLLDKKNDPNLLVGFDRSDDAAVYKVADDLAIVHTLDFFPPMVEDPYTFGQIAAANALSDVYAMGGDVTTALNIVCFPDEMDLNILGKIMMGGNDKVIEAGGIIAGGHSINDTDVKYGLSVTGLVHPDKLLRNNGAIPGDALILTKPLGIGIVTSAKRVDQVSDEAFDMAVKSMTTLNKYASEIIRKYDVHACTDVTGFSLLGHLMEMVGDEVSANIISADVPRIRGAVRYAEHFLITAAGQRNRSFVGSNVEFHGIPFGMEELLFDPQTSGGLLVALPKEEAYSALEEIKKIGLPCGVIGSITDRKEKAIEVF